MATGTATTVTCPGYTNQAFVNDQDGKKNFKTCSLVIANDSQNSQESLSEPSASPTNEAAVPGLPDSTSSSNISSAINSSTFHRTAKMATGTATTGTSPGYTNQTFVNDQDGKENFKTCSLVIANNSQNSQESLSEPPASPTNDTTVPGLPDSTSSSNISKEFDPSFLRVTIHSSSGSSSGSQPNRADLKDGVACLSKQCLSLCIQISLLLVFCAAVALLVTFGTVPDFQRLFLTKANVQMRVSDEFQPSMVNVSSPESVEYGNLFCHHLTQTIIKGMEVEAADTCTVKNLRNGSIIVDAQVNVLTNQNLTADDFLHALKKAARADGDYIMLGIIKVFNNSLDVTSVHTVKQPGGVPERKVPAEFDCSVGGAHFKPFPYTHPAYCGHFQLCKDGEGISLLCEEGLEFADDSGTTHTPCRYKSNTTYCGRKRSEGATSSTPSTTAATTSSSTTTTATDSTKSTNATQTVPAEPSTTLPSRTSATTTSSTTTTATDSTKSTNATPTVTAEATTTDICSSIPQNILSNDPSLYTCTFAWTFQPRTDTYPNNCGHYVECWNGMDILRKCANGTHFAYGKEPRMPCHNTWDDATFCRQMTLAKTCQ